MFLLSNSGNRNSSFVSIFFEVLILLENDIQDGNIYCPFIDNYSNNCLARTGITGRKLCTSAAVLPVAVMKSL